MADGKALPQDVLVLEDNGIIAIYVEETILEFGVKTVRAVGNVQHALAAITERMPDFAVLDVDLGNEKCFAVADKLAEAKVPFVFASGYGDKENYPPRFAAIDVLVKPYTPETLRTALEAAIKK